MIPPIWCLLLQASGALLGQRGQGSHCWHYPQDQNTGAGEGRTGVCAYQIADVVEAMSQDAGVRIEELRVDGGPTRNRYLMQFQSDILGVGFLYRMRRSCLVSGTLCGRAGPGIL